MKHSRILQAMALSVASAAWLVLATAASAATYKWVDEKGVVHYTDKIPPEAVNRGKVELSKDGVPLRKVDPALTPEQARAKQEEEERKRAEAKLKEETARKDRALLASYTSENEIDLARQRALAAIDNVLQSVNTYSERIKQRQAELKEKMASYKNKPVPPVLEREYESLNEELDRQREVAIIKRKEAQTVAAKYDAEKTRFHELAVTRAAENAAAAQNSVVAPAATRK